MKDNECLETPIRNCLEFESEIKCTKCLPEFSLKEINGVLNC